MDELKRIAERGVEYASGACCLAIAGHDARMAARWAEVAAHWAGVLVQYHGVTV